MINDKKFGAGTWKTFLLSSYTQRKQFNDKVYCLVKDVQNNVIVSVSCNINKEVFIKLIAK